MGAAVGEVLREAAGEGHTALPRGEVLERLGRLVPGAADGAAEAAVGSEVGHRRVAAREADAHKLMMEVQHLLQQRSVYRDPTFAARVQKVLAEARSPAVSPALRARAP